MKSAAQLLENGTGHVEVSFSNWTVGHQWVPRMDMYISL